MNEISNTKTQEELDLEIEELLKQIEEEANTEEEYHEENIAEEAQDVKDSEFAESVKSLFDADETEEAILRKIQDALKTSQRMMNVTYSPDALLAQEEEIREIYPQFDILEELRKNEVFRRLISIGTEVHSALLISNEAYADKIIQEIQTAAQREFAEKLRSGMEFLPSAMQKKSGGSQFDVSKLSDEQFEEIENKVKQNKRVFL